MSTGLNQASVKSSLNLTSGQNIMVRQTASICTHYSVLTSVYHTIVILVWGSWGGSICLSVYLHTNYSSWTKCKNLVLVFPWHAMIATNYSASIHNTDMGSNANILTVTSHAKMYGKCLACLALIWMFVMFVVFSSRWIQEGWTSGSSEVSVSQFSAHQV